MKKRICIALTVALFALLAACGGIAETAETAPVSLAEVMDSFQLDEEMIRLEGEDLTDVYGIALEDVAQFAAAVNGSGIKADEIVLVEAVDEDAAARVKELLDERYQSKLNELENYLPEEYAVVEACSVDINGKFVSMIVSPNAGDLVTRFNEAVK